MAVPSSNEKITMYPITTSFVNLPCTWLSRLVTIEEDGVDPAAMVGLKVKYPNDNYTAIATYKKGQTIYLGDEIAHGNGLGEVLGWPAQTGINQRTADIYCQIAAASGTCTIRVVETA